MARRHRRDKPYNQPPKPAASTRDRMARVVVTDDAWTDFRALAGNQSIATVLGELVEREVDRYRTRRLKADQLDDRELVDALEPALELQDDLTTIVARLERRLDRAAPPPNPR
jgi:hypothetical protein